MDQPCTYLLRGLPAHEVEIRATVHDVVYRQKHGPFVPTLSFTIPTYEAVVSRYFSGDDEQAQFEDLCARVPFVVAPDGPTSVTVEF